MDKRSRTYCNEGDEEDHAAHSEEEACHDHTDQHISERGYICPRLDDWMPGKET